MTHESVHSTLNDYASHTPPRRITSPHNHQSRFGSRSVVRFRHWLASDHVGTWSSGWPLLAGCQHDEDLRPIPVGSPDAKLVPRCKRNARSCAARRLLRRGGALPYAYPEAAGGVALEAAEVVVNGKPWCALAYSLHTHSGEIATATRSQGSFGWWDVSMQ